MEKIFLENETFGSLSVIENLTLREVVVSNNLLLVS